MPAPGGTALALDLHWRTQYDRLGFGGPGESIRWEGAGTAAAAFPPGSWLRARYGRAGPGAWVRHIADVALWSTHHACSPASPHQELFAPRPIPHVNTSGGRDGGGCGPLTLPHTRSTFPCSVGSALRGSR